MDSPGRRDYEERTRRRQSALGYAEYIDYASRGLRRSRQGGRLMASNRLHTRVNAPDSLTRGPSPTISRRTSSPRAHSAARSKSLRNCERLTNATRTNSVSRPGLCNPALGQAQLPAIGQRARSTRWWSKPRRAGRLMFYGQGSRRAPIGVGGVVDGRLVIGGAKPGLVQGGLVT